MQPSQPERVVFAIGEDRATRNQVVILGVPEAAWEYMKEGNTHTFDLTKLGLPIKIIMFGAKDREEAIAAIPVAPHTCDMRNQDFGIHCK
jgi:hypothetical protein